jgi:hypothetical protein
LEDAGPGGTAADFAWELPDFAGDERRTPVVDIIAKDLFPE